MTAQFHTHRCPHCSFACVSKTGDPQSCACPVVTTNVLPRYGLRVCVSRTPLAIPVLRPHQTKLSHQPAGCPLRRSTGRQRDRQSDLLSSLNSLRSTRWAGNVPFWPGDLRLSPTQQCLVRNVVRVRVRICTATAAHAWANGWYTAQRASAARAARRAPFFYLRQEEQCR